jgi:UV DNA damage repair endonuclease
MVSANSPSISYLGIPKTWASSGFRISTYKDLLNLVLDLCKFNSSIHCKSVCIDTGEIDFDKSIFDSSIDETDPETSGILLEIQEIIHKERMRVYFLVTKDYFLGSQIEDVFFSSVKFLDFIGCFLDSIGVNYPSIIIRIGSAYGNRKETMKTFCKRINNLCKSASSKICVMNDDKPSLFSITDLLSGVYYDAGLPLCFRTLAHHFNHGGLSIREALYLASTTWKNGEIPLMIHSESRDINEDGIFLSPLVSTGLTMRIPTFGLQCEVIIDSSDKELTYISYLKNYKSLPPIVINRVSDK